MHAPLPPVLRSWEHLFKTHPELRPAALPIKPSGTTYTMVQELSFVDLSHFAVGRWDGSLSIFKFTESTSQGPVISKVVNAPSSEGVQMITWLSPTRFASSNDAGSMIVWSSPSGLWTDLSAEQTLSYDISLGVANSGSSVTLINSTSIYLVVGHESGFLSIWQGEPDGQGFQFLKKLDLRSPHPVNPFGLQNIRGVSLLSITADQAIIVTGSENGNICVISIPDGSVLSTTVFNPKAQRGINSICTFGQNLLVANCAVGQSDKNLWYYQIDGNNWSVNLCDSINLQKDPSLAQVFNFDVIWGYYSKGFCWYASTEEGLLWMGGIQNNEQLTIIGYQPVTAKLGAALGMTVDGNLAMAGYDLYAFNTEPPVAAKAAGPHPERFIWWG
jgi:hypothetical protein